ncbi:hypothetical protein ACFWDF_00235, partial [Streptomyces diastaticus]|uniref:hypothetical protein n=1 Tax=Streptomyces diastaticus TaxID=1956 RepID=UPI0036D1526F
VLLRLLGVSRVVLWGVYHPAADLSGLLWRPARAPHLIGGADVAAELDAKRAVKQGTELAATL